MHSSALQERGSVWLAWLTSLALIMLLTSAALRWTAPTQSIADLQVIGAAIPSEMISGQRVTAFALVDFGPEIERGWVRMEACPKQSVQVTDCLRWPIVSIRPDSEGLWAGSLGHLGMHELGDYEVTVRTYVNGGLDAPMTSDAVSITLTVLNSYEQSRLDPPPVSSLSSGALTCGSPFEGWRRLDFRNGESTSSNPSALRDSWAWNRAIILDNNSMLFACPPTAGTFHMTLDGSSALNRGAHAIVQAGGHAIFESLLDGTPVRLVVSVTAHSPIIVAFVNDLYRPPEDRTLWISDVNFTPSSASH